MSGDDVAVSVGHAGPNTIAADSESVETRTSFGIVLESHSVPAHVHCRLGGDLARIATLDRSNYYVDPSNETYVPVIVEDVPEPVEGTLELSTGYGATSVTIDVTVTPGPPPVEVDETLARPRREPDRTDEPALAESDMGTLGIVVLAVLAIGLAATTAAVVGGTVAFLAFLVVVTGVVAAAVLLLR